MARLEWRYGSPANNHKRPRELYGAVYLGWSTVGLHTKLLVIHVQCSRFENT